VPAGQFGAEDVPPGQARPAAQPAHAVLPLADWYWPPGQLEQLGAPVAVPYWPPGQPAQLPALPVVYVPAGQLRHSEVPGVQDERTGKVSPANT
jgi:hypothetical protein